MAIVLSGTTNDITVNGVSVATDADLKEIGVGQTWQDVTASRSVGVTYTNTTGKPIFVSIISAPSDSSRFLTIASITMSLIQASGASYTGNTNVGIVPEGKTYSFTGGTFINWYELR